MNPWERVALPFLWGLIIGTAATSYWLETAPSCSTDTECEEWGQENPIRCKINEIIYERR